jgi:hypothetical protein
MMLIRLLHAFWILLVWFTADLAQTTHGVRKGSDINHVAHAGGFALGQMVRLVAARGLRAADYR